MRFSSAIPLVLVGLLASTAIATPCGAPSCKGIYKCGKCDVEDPQICKINGNIYVCKKNSYGQGGGISLVLLTCYLC